MNRIKPGDKVKLDGKIYKVKLVNGDDLVIETFDDEGLSDLVFVKVKDVKKV